MSNLPAPATMYRALLRHDPTYEGVFWLGVRTTGVFCRPTCRARTPKRENVEFFGAPSEALHAGYRPCMKCRPLDHGRKPPDLVARLLVAVERDPLRRYRDAELAELGIDASTARRQFKRYCGMTFQAYQRARRMGLALTDIRKGRTVLDSQLDQGFESGSGFREAFARTAVALARTRRAARKMAGDAAGRNARAGRRSRPASPRFRRPSRPRARVGSPAAPPEGARAARRAPGAGANRARTRRLFRRPPIGIR